MSPSLDMNLHVCVTHIRLMILSWPLLFILNIPESLSDVSTSLAVYVCVSLFPSSEFLFLIFPPLMLFIFRSLKPASWPPGPEPLPL